MTAEREALADRVRAALPHDRPVREVSMFGGLSFMVDDSMVSRPAATATCSSASTPHETTSSSTSPVPSPRSWGPIAQWDRAGSPSPTMASPPTSNSPSGPKSVWSTEPHRQRATTDRGPGSGRGPSAAFKRPIMPLGVLAPHANVLHPLGRSPLRA